MILNHKNSQRNVRVEVFQIKTTEHRSTEYSEVQHVEGLLWFWFCYVSSLVLRDSTVSLIMADFCSAVLSVSKVLGYSLMLLVQYKQSFILKFFKVKFLHLEPESSSDVH